MLPANCCCGTAAPVNIVGPQGASASGVDGADGAIVLLGQAVAVDFNSTGDKLITGLPARYIITEIIVQGATVSLIPAAGGIYTGAGKTGTVLVLAAQTYSAVSDSDKWVSLNLATGAQSGGNVLTGDTLYLYLDTPSTDPATATINVYGYAL